MANDLYPKCVNSFCDSVVRQGIKVASNERAKVYEKLATI